LELTGGNSLGGGKEYQKSLPPHKKKKLRCPKGEKLAVERGGWGENRENGEKLPIIWKGELSGVRIPEVTDSRKGSNPQRTSSQRVRASWKLGGTVNRVRKP